LLANNADPSGVLARVAGHTTFDLSVEGVTNRDWNRDGFPGGAGQRSRAVITAEVDQTTKWAHPETKQAASLHKWTERTWRHLDTCQFETVIKANVPSMKHRAGSVEEIAVPWADRYQRITQLLAQAVIIGL
jgi:hypothetical protein